MEVSPAPGGALVSVRIRPRSRPGVELSEGTLVIRVASAPVGGRATEEARRTLARALRVAPSRVSLRSGLRSKRKVFAVIGLDPGRAAARLKEAARP